MATVMIRFYRGSGRPEAIEIALAQQDVVRLKRYGYRAVKECGDDYTSKQAWNDMTHREDADGKTYMN